MFYLETTSFRILWSRLGSVCRRCLLKLLGCSFFQLLIDTVPGCFSGYWCCTYRLRWSLLSEAQDQGRNSADAHLGVGSKYDFRGSWLHILRGMGKHDRESKAVVVITYALVGHTQTHVHNLSHDTHACARPDAMWLPLVGDILEAPLRPKSRLQRPGARPCQPA